MGRRRWRAVLVAAVLVTLLVGLWLAGCGGPFGQGGKQPPDRQAKDERADAAADAAPGGAAIPMTVIPAASPLLEWMPGLGLLLLVAGVGLFIWNRGSAGMAAVAMGITLMVSSLALQMFAWWFAVIGGLLVLVCLLIVMVGLWRALRQTVQTVAMVRPLLSATADQEIFGTDSVTGKVRAIQSKLTQKLVKAARGATPETGTALPAAASTTTAENVVDPRELALNAATVLAEQAAAEAAGQASAAAETMAESQLGLDAAAVGTLAGAAAGAVAAGEANGGG